ncbi:sensor histidine kinase [Corynebacterium uterequi]|uniref:histidine kinase n=1 Tax=Corynebacterium uterequi TaxID=1072256 RepID=A0A0G3HBQ7_9CORY|nr:histidine kinase [Corynebacterium uterequi]AKK10724.1 signal transduction histidine kinase [Corynebacterium uterequi]
MWLKLRNNLTVVATLVALALFFLTMLTSTPIPGPFYVLLIAALGVCMIWGLQNPRAALLSTAAIFILMWLVGNRYGLGIFYGAFLLTIVAARCNYWWALGFAVFIGFAGIYDPEDGDIALEPEATIIWLLLTLGALLLGIWIRKTVKSRERAREEQKRRQEELAKSLHDSVAATLTSLVVQAEALSLTRGAKDPELADDLDTLADLGRNAITQTRTLLASLNTPSGLTGDKPGPTFEKQFQNQVRLLSRHKFRVRSHYQLEKTQLSAVQAGALGQVMHEAVVNIIKYAQPKSPVILTVEQPEDSEKIILTVVNEVGHKDVSHLGSSGIGLRSMQAHMQSIRGSITTTSENDRWTLIAVAPC